MAYNKQELIDKSIEVIKEHELVFISDVIAYLPCSTATFYNHKLEQLEELKELLEQNIIETKIQLRKKWFNSDNATLQLALYKLLGTDEERKKLSQTFQDLNVTSKDEQIECIIINTPNNGETAKHKSDS